MSCGTATGWWPSSCSRPRTRGGLQFKKYVSLFWRRPGVPVADGQLDLGDITTYVRRVLAGRVADAQPAKYVLLFDLDDARKTATTSLLCTAPYCYCAVSTMGWPSTCMCILVRASYVWNVYWPLARARRDQRRAKNWHLDELNLNPMGWAHRSSHTTSEGFMLTYKHQFIISYASGGPIPPGARSSPPQACRRAAGAPAGGLRPATSAFWRPPSARSCSSGS